MAARTIWKGFISFGLVSVPVKAYTASAGSTSEIKFNQIHRDCNQRVQYKKMCPEHGELKTDEIVSGYEFAEGRYVLFDPAELDKLRTPKDRTIDIAAVVPTGSIDPAYFTGATYYLAPDGPAAQKPYALLHRALAEGGRSAFAKVVLREKESVLLLRPAGRLLAMTMLSYADEVRKPSEFEPEVVPVEVSPQELKLAKTLIEAMDEPEFDLAKYKDQYKDRVRQLIEAKVAGKEIVEPPAADLPVPATNLMEALQKSVEQARKSAKPPMLTAPSTAEKAVRARKRKSS